MSNVKIILENLEKTFEVIELVLNEWQGSGNIQFPTLLGMIGKKANWSDKEIKENDPIVRYYVRNHPEWIISRGAHGGVQRASDKNKKNVDKIAKAKLKQEMQEMIEAKVANLIQKPQEVIEEKLNEDSDGFDFDEVIDDKD